MVHGAGRIDSGMLRALDKGRRGMQTELQKHLFTAQVTGPAKRGS